MVPTHTVAETASVLTGMVLTEPLAGQAEFAPEFKTNIMPFCAEFSATGRDPEHGALAAEAIRRMFFPSGSDKPEFRFTLTPATLDGQALRVKLDVDGQDVEYRHDQPRATAMKWPGPANGSAGIAFEPGGGSPLPPSSGPWALFRLLDQGQTQLVQGAQYRLSYSVGGHSASFILEADSLFNPLGKNDLQRFTCGF